MRRTLEHAKAQYLEGIRDGNCAEVIEKYAGDRYGQHSTPVKDGKDGFMQFIAHVIERNIGQGYDNAGGGFTVDLGRGRRKNA